MNVVEAITALRAAGGAATVNAGSLVVDAPPGLPAAVWDALAIHKATLVDLLTPTTTYAELARHEEREAIQAEAEAPADAATFARPRPARRCRLVRDTPWERSDLGRVIFPAGLEAPVVDDLGEIEDPFVRINTKWLLEVARGAGRKPIVVDIDGRARVLDESCVLILNEGDPS
jgi:hypothetical protein